CGGESWRLQLSHVWNILVYGNIRGGRRENERGGTAWQIKSHRNAPRVCSAPTTSRRADGARAPRGDKGCLVPVAATLYEWLMLVHVLAAMIWLGGLVTLGALATQVLRGGEPDAIARLVRSLRVVGPLVLAPAMVAVLGFGIWLVLDSDAWDFGQTWIWLALALFGAAFLICALLQSLA